MSRGFSLIELILVIAILGIIASVGVVYLRGFNTGVEITSEAQTIISDLRQIRSNAMIGSGRLKWGIHFVNDASDYYELYSTPTDYSDGSKSVTTTNYLPNGITFSNPASSTTKDVIFSIISGATSADTVVISSSTGTQTITINALGAIY